MEEMGQGEEERAKDDFRVRVMKGWRSQALSWGRPGEKQVLGEGKQESDFGLVKFELPIVFPRRMLSWQVEIHPPSLA